MSEATVFESGLRELEPDNQQLNICLGNFEGTCLQC